MKCKNCLHYDVCHYHIDEETDMTVNECPHEFKHKDQYVKLPVYIGQPVWTLYRRYGGKWELQEGKVSMVTLKSDKTWKFRVSENSSVIDRSLKDIGDPVFLSFELATKALNVALAQTSLNTLKLTDNLLESLKNSLS
jgi:hypothetical protein